MTDATFISLNVKRRLNGVVLKLKAIKGSITIDKTSFSRNVLVDNRLFLFYGNFNTTVEELTKKIGPGCHVLEKRNGRKQLLKPEDRPFSRLSFLLNEQVLPKVSSRISIVYFQFIPPAFFDLQLRNIRKLVLCSVPLKELNIQDLLKLRYLKLQNLGLKHLQPPPQILQYCNLSNNRLRYCTVRSRVLDIRSNRIVEMNINYPQAYLNISNNPLEKLHSSSRVLYIKNTRLKHPLSTPAWKIVADGTKGIRFSSCPNLSHLSVDHAHLFKLCKVASLVTVLSARNNYLEDLPYFPNLKHSNFSGNFLTELSGVPHLISTNISKNDLVNFSLTDFNHLLSIKLSFNPLEFLCIPDSSTTRVHLNKDLASELGISVPVEKIPHSCNSTRKYSKKYIIRGIVNNKAVTIILILSTNSEHSLDFKHFWEISLKMQTAVHFLECFVAQTVEFIRLYDEYSTALFILIGTKHVLVKSVGIPCIFFNFSECKKVSNSNTIKTFNNVGRWLIIPLFCNLPRGEESRFHKLRRKLEDIHEVFQFLRCSCPLALEFSVKNSPTLFEPTEFSVKEDKSRDRLWPKSVSFENLMCFTSSGFWGECSEYIGSSNIDFGMSFHNDLQESFNGYQAGLLTNISVPVFVFLKLIYGTCSHPVIKAEKYNILNIIDTFCKIFTGRCIEKSYLFYVVIFDSPVAAVLWGLRVKNTLAAVGIFVGVGITGDTVLRMQSEGRVRLCGPAFNKSSRMANLGIGVFCSNFLNISHSLIECVDEGECFFKGFPEKERVISISLKKDEECW